MAHLRRHLTYANVVSSLALFLALSGGAVYAAGKIGSNQIGEGAVRSPQIKNRNVKRQDIAGGSVNGKKVSNESLTGKDIKEDTLGLVPLAQDARTLTGVGIRMVRASVPDGAGPTQFLNQSGLVASLSCLGGTAAIQVRSSNGGEFGTVADPGGAQQFSTSPATATTEGPGAASLRRVDGSLTRLDFDLMGEPNGYGSSDDCFLNGFLVSGK
jgi:hypothetical protein